MKIRCCLVVMGLGIGMAARPVAARVLPPAAEGHGPVVRMAPCSRAPAIDGTIDEAEWSEALKLAGSADSSRGNLEARQAWAYFTFDRDNLYFAVKSETHPGGRLYYWPHRPDEYVGQADGIELWVAPLPSPDEKPIDRVQLWFDPGGAAWGQIHRYGVGVNFTGSVAHGNRIEGDTWMFEASVAWADVGVKGNPIEPGAHFLVRPTRNWRYPGNYTSWGYPKAFRDAASMLRVIVDPEAPVVRVPEIGELAAGSADVRLHVRNRTQGAQAYRAVLALYPFGSAEPVAQADSVLELGAGVADGVELTHTFEIPMPARKQLVSTPTHYLAMQVKRVSDDAVCFERAVNVAPPRERKWAELPSRDVKIVGGYYPYYRKVYARVELGDLPDQESVTRAVVRVFREGGDEALGRGDITAFEYSAGYTIIDVPDLGEGTYELRAEVFRGDEKAALDPAPSRSFVRHVLPWEHNEIGVSTQVFPPFTPLQVQDDRIACVLREHDVNGDGFWRQVRSMDTELLAEPMRLECTVDGRRLEWDLQDTLEFVTRADHEVVHRGGARCSALEARTRSTWEYDGMMKVELELEPRTEAAIDELCLAIPMKAEEARLLHATTFLRANPCMAVPAGEGVVWDSSRMVHSKALGTFVPYIWLGGPERGIYWFADSDRGWIAADDKADFQVVRRGDVVELRVRFVNAPAVVTDTRRIVFGIGATPVKPQPAGFRGWHGRFSRSTRPVQYALASWRFAGLSNCESLDPLNGDWSIMDKLVETQRKGEVDEAFLAQWLERHGEGKNKSLLVDLVGVFRKAARGEIVIYTNPACESGNTPQARTFGREWRGDNGYIGVHITPSYVDYAVWCLDRMLAAGVEGGIYHDNTFPMSSLDLISGNAYVRDDGRIQAGWDMFGHRELYKRMFTAAWQRTGKWPLIAVHITNSHNASYFGFATIGVDLELEYGTDRTFQEKFTFDFLNCGTHGKQEGLIPIVLCRQGGGPRSTAQPGDSPEVKAEKRAFDAYLERTRLGAGFVMDFVPLGSSRLWYLFGGLVEAGYIDEETEFLPYWRNGDAVRADDGVLVSVYRAPGSAILAICGAADRDGTWRVKIDPARLGLSEDPVMLDLEADWANRDKNARRQLRPGGEPEFIDPTSTFRRLGPGELELDLRRHDYRLVLVRDE